MRVSMKLAIILFLAVCLSAGILLYPTGASCTIKKACHLKIVEPFNEPNIRFGEPGDSPNGSIGLLGSSQGTSIDAQQPVLPNPDIKTSRTAGHRAMQLLLFYLINFSSGPFQGW